MSYHYTTIFPNLTYLVDSHIDIILSHPYRWVSWWVRGRELNIHFVKWKTLSNYMLISPQVFLKKNMNSIKSSQYSLSLVSVLMLMDHLSSARSLISSPYLPHHFIGPKGNNKSLIHYPLTEAAMRKYLITGNKLNFNHRIFRQQYTAY